MEEKCKKRRLVTGPVPITQWGYVCPIINREPICLYHGAAIQINVTKPRLEGEIVWFFFVQKKMMLLAFITVTGCKEHDQNSGSTIKVDYVSLIKRPSQNKNGSSGYGYDLIALKYRTSLATALATFIAVAATLNTAYSYCK